MVKKQMKFNGKIYRATATGYDTKKYAQDACKWHRNRGFLARYVKNNKGKYTIYIRDK